jgi:hypothetical protein
MKRRALVLAFCIATVVGALAGTALAGEVTGSGTNSNQNQGVSWCSFSGLNDRLPGQGPVEPRAQSYGQELKLGIVDPHQGNPGLFCNPNKTFLPPNPNRTK